MSTPLSTTLSAWKIEAVSRFDFRLDDVALRALLDLFDQPLSPIERQVALLCVLMARTQKPFRAAALSAHIEQALKQAEERSAG